MNVFKKDKISVYTVVSKKSHKAKVTLARASLRRQEA